MDTFVNFYYITCNRTDMRKTFEPQLTLGTTPIEEVEVPPNTKSHLAALTAALKYIYANSQWNEKIFDLLSSRLMKEKKATGRTGMSLWELFVLAQVRLCMNISYDELHHISNYDTMIRGIMGVLPTDYSLGKQYSYQNIYDNVTLLDDELLKEINDVIVEVGHEVFKKKGKTDVEASVLPCVPLQCKVDTFVVESDTHFPTDYNLLWDSARKCLDTVDKLKKIAPLTGWRKTKDWSRSLKGLMRTVGQITGKGGKNKEERLQNAVTAYLTKARALERKVASIIAYTPTDQRTAIILLELCHYHEMLTKHIDLLDRRILQGEVIPHDEKLFSIFQPYVEWINKGKKNPSVEIGKKLAITTDQYHLIVDYQIAENQTDNQLTLIIASRLIQQYRIESLSLDRGFFDKEDRPILQAYIPEVIMPKKGKLSKAEKALESAPAFKKLKNKHNAVESNINELEHRGLNRCPDRSEYAFKRYIGLAVSAYNLHKIGRKLQADQLAEEKRQAEALQQAA